ncbi:TadE-like protein [Sulfitobacter guttiformis]|uniref:TadE-like protein n=2 Tax=Sulfitobacter guttiformis TaxID=74349 RepID=A0A420DK79_9RHOB|nr:TadE-like protein [Sulfitobacter guttiformis]
MVPFKSRFLSRFRADQSGAVAVEFVLIAPILLTLVFGIVTVGYFMGVSHSVSQLASGAARSSVSGLDEAERRAIARSYLNEAGARYPLLVQDAVTSTIAFDTAEVDGITVSVVYDVDGSLLDIANGFLKLGITTINGSAYVAY